MAQQSAFDEGLRELGLTDIPVPMWGIAAVIAGPQFYEPDEGGTLAAIVPAFERSGLVDLVACSFLSREMRSRKGIASVLGHEWIARAVDTMDALTVFDDAFTWLRGLCRGVVVIDWNDAPRLLREVPQLRCQSRRTADLLADAFERPLPYPPILLPTEKDHD
jgi:hypothetical protein